MDNDFQLPDSEIKEIKEIIKKASSEDMFKEIDVDWEILKKQAYTFLLSYEKLETLEKTNKLNNLNKLIQGEPGSPGYLENYALGSKKEAHYKRAKYLLAFQFDEAINKFRGGLPKEAIYVYENNKTGEIYSYPMKMTDLVRRANKKGRLDISLTQLKSEQKKSIEENDTIPKEHIAQARAAYLGVSNRLNVYFEKRNEAAGSVNKRQLQRNNGILMWKLGKDWTLARVLNRGDLKEAYVAALLTKHKTVNDRLYGISPGKPDYYSHQLISAFYNYIWEVTNKPAIVAEDVIASDKQYAVKGARASLPGFEQYLKTARWIIKQDNVFSKNDLEDFFKENFAEEVHRNNVIQITNKLTKKSLEDLGLKDYEIKAITLNKKIII